MIALIESGKIIFIPEKLYGTQLITKGNGLMCLVFGLSEKRRISENNGLKQLITMQKQCVNSLVVLWVHSLYSDRLLSFEILRKLFKKKEKLFCVERLQAHCEKTSVYLEEKKKVFTRNSLVIPQFLLEIEKESQSLEDNRKNHE